MQFRVWGRIEACSNDLVSNATPLWISSVLAPSGTVGKLHDSTTCAQEVWHFLDRDGGADALAEGARQTLTLGLEKVEAVDVSVQEVYMKDEFVYLLSSKPSTAISLGILQVAQARMRSGNLSLNSLRLDLNVPLVSIPTT